MKDFFEATDFLESATSLSPEVAAQLANEKLKSAIDKAPIVKTSISDVPKAHEMKFWWQNPTFPCNVQARLFCFEKIQDA